MDSIVKNITKVVLKGRVAAGMVHEEKGIFYKSYTEKMAFQVAMTQNETKHVLCLLIPNGWQKNSAPREL